MRKIKVLSLITTIMDIVCFVLFIWAGFVSLSWADKVGALTGVAVSNIDKVNPDSPVGGYQLFALMAGSFGGVIGSILLWTIAIFCFIFAAYMVAPSVTGIVLLTKSKKQGRESKIKSFSADGIVKIVFSAIPIVLALFSILLDPAGSFKMAIWVILYSGTILGLSIWQMLSIRDEKMTILAEQLLNE